MEAAKWFAAGWFARWFVTRAPRTVATATLGASGGAAAVRGAGEVPGDRDELDAAEAGA